MEAPSQFGAGGGTADDHDVGAFAARSLLVEFEAQIEQQAHGLHSAQTRMCAGQA